MTIVVIIPVLNEEQAIGKVLAAIPSGLVSRVIVVDNGSTDRTAEVAAQAGAMVVSEPQRGYGAACLRGIACAAPFQPDIVVFLDGDYSDYPEEMTTLVTPIIEQDYDLVIGSRMRGMRERGALPLQSLIGNRVVPFLIRMLYGVPCTDLGPFRAIRFETLLALGMVDRTFGWTVEMQIKAARMGYRILEVPVRYRRRIGSSKISGTLSGTIRATVRILSVIVKQVFSGFGIRRTPGVRGSGKNRK